MFLEYMKCDINSLKDENMVSISPNSVAYFSDNKENTTHVCIDGNNHMTLKVSYDDFKSAINTYSTHKIYTGVA